MTLTDFALIIGAIGTTVGIAMVVFVNWAEQDDRVQREREQERQSSASHLPAE